ncbi:dihydropteroate synthase [Rhodovarius crocodyli]|uniref:Dihydropteroate synthase n=2 Tax=Rhodovarius crocodyli TaxID=1979269 RepID=A0A437MPS4_9PROT|nr:dihydropteroate synthase [Rhodovarius crocodyli]
MDIAEPWGLLAGEEALAAVAAGRAVPLAGGALAFSLVRLAGAVIPATDLPPALRERMSAAPPPFAGLPGDRPLIMGILNVTPDSFSDGGLHDAPQSAIAAARAMLAEGADLIDIGGESTRPGAAPVTPEQELARVLPVVRALAGEAVLSIDTRHALVMAECLAAGAHIINDVSALRHDPQAVGVVARAQAPVIIMHMPGDDPRTMQSLAHYEDVALEVAGFLAGRIAALEAAGIPRARIMLDPGIGFGKTAAHNLELTRRLPVLAGLGCRVLYAASRKTFIGRIAGVETPADRMPGSLAVALAALERGATMLRVHDVAETRQAVALWQAMTEARKP